MSTVFTSIYLDVRGTVGSQVDMEAVVVVVSVGTQLLVDQDNPVVLYRPVGLDYGTHG